MKTSALAALALLGLSSGLAAQEVLVEAEGFADPGGWVLDQQSMDRMGSPYLLAHGLGVPVKDASTYWPTRRSGKPATTRSPPSAIKMRVSSVTATLARSKEVSSSSSPSMRTEPRTPPACPPAASEMLVT